MTQPDGISPRLHRQHPVSMDGLSSVTPTSACSSTGFFKEEDHSYPIPTEDTSKKSRSRSQAVLLSPVCLKRPYLPSHSKPYYPHSLWFVGFLLITLVIAPWLLGNQETHPLESTRVLREVVVDDKEVEARCNARRLWGGHVSQGRDQCVEVLPSSVVEREDSWLIAVHVDRKPVSPSESLRGGLRGSIQHRNLPHLYFVRALEATLNGLSKIEPGATIDVAVLTEGRWGGLVDEVGMPVDWDIPKQICSHLGLHCIQSMVLLNDESIEVTDALECATIADVFVSSESDFSVASSALSPRVKVLTDRWTTDEMEMKIALNPAGTVAGMPQSQRDLIKNTLSEYHECSLHR